MPALYCIGLIRQNKHGALNESNDITESTAIRNDEAGQLVKFVAYIAPPGRLLDIVVHCIFRYTHPIILYPVHIQLCLIP